MMPDEESAVRWVDLRQAFDPIEAKTVVDFLADHGIRVQQLGGQTSALPAISLTDIRLRVPEDQLEEATEVLAAFAEGKAEQHSYRDGGGDSSPASYQAPVLARKWPFAVGLALIVPIGGGHFYARHGAAATLIATGAVAAIVGSVFGRTNLSFMWLALVAIDAIFAPLAVRRFNAGRVTPDSRQRVWAFVAVVVAFCVALAKSY
jgi:hypothetical protein